MRLADIGGPVAVTDLEGIVRGLTPSARSLLHRLGVDARTVPMTLPDSLQTRLAETPLGEATDWAPEHAREARLGCTRYSLGSGLHLLLMREISAKHRAHSYELHRQRLETAGRLVASIVHDLRAPLGSIMLTLDGIQRMGGEPSDDLDESLELIDHATKRMRHSIDGLLDFARLGPPARHRVSLRDAIGGAVQTLRPAFRERSHQLVTDIPEDLAWVMANRFVLEQILLSLMQNAFEAVAGAATVTITATSGTTDDGRAAVVATISDAGPGIPTELQQRIFDPFFTTKRSGTGLGLATARDAVLQMGGQLAVVPSEVGACLRLTLLKAGAGHKGELT